MLQQPFGGNCRWNPNNYNTKRQVIPLNRLLYELGIDHSTLQHWKECKPNNLKIINKARVWCEDTIFHAIQRDPKLVFEYWKLTRQGETPDTKGKENLLKLEEFGDKGEFTSGESDNNK